MSEKDPEVRSLHCLLCFKRDKNWGKYSFFERNGLSMALVQPSCFCGSQSESRQLGSRAFKATITWVFWSWHYLQWMRRQSTSFVSLPYESMHVQRQLTLLKITRERMSKPLLCSRQEVRIAVDCVIAAVNFLLELTSDEIATFVYGSKEQLAAWYSYTALIWAMKGTMLFFFDRLT